MRIALLALSVFLLASCSPLSLPSVAQTGIPDEAPSICGIITSLLPDQLLVEEDPEADAGSAKAAVRLQEGTRLLYRNGRAAEYEALAVGHTVSAWFDGPVAESYPVQAAAGVIVLEEADECR